MELSDALTIVAILITAWAIVYEVDKTRRLSRKTTAISLLSDQCMNEQWLKALGLITKMRMDRGNYDWKELARKKFTVGTILEGEDIEISTAIRDVLNYFEFISVAVLSCTASEEIVKQNLGDLMLIIHDEVKEYIEESRKKNNIKDAYINYEKIIKKWEKTPNAIGPIA